MALPTKNIHALEIFGVGKWNDDEYTEQDLDDMVFAFDKVGFEPTVKAGHEAGQEIYGQPSLGYVKRIWRSGKKLLADIAGIPAKFAALLEVGAYRRVSAEVFWDYEAANGETYPFVLKAVAFLGASVPAVTSLRAVEALYRRSSMAYDNAGNEFRTYEIERTSRTKENSMELKTYDSEQAMIVDYARYSSHNCDRATSERIMAEINAGTPQRELAATFARYQRGDVAPKSAREASPKEISDAGIALHNDAVERLQARGLQHTPENYRKSFSEAMQGAPSVAATYSRGVKLDDDDDADVHSFYESGDTEMSPVVVISNLVTSIPRPPSNDIDFVTAARAVNEFVPIDIRQLAAEECLQNLSDKSGKSLEEIEREHEALADAAESGEFSEEGLRELCWPLFNRDR